jgi:hypothetical protein
MWDFGGRGRRKKTIKEGLNMGGRVVLKWIFEKQDEWYELDFTYLGQGPVAGSCEHDQSHSGSIECEKLRSNGGTGGFPERTHLRGVSELNVYDYNQFQGI